LPGRARRLARFSTGSRPRPSYLPFKMTWGGVLVGEPTSLTGAARAAI